MTLTQVDVDLTVRELSSFRPGVVLFLLNTGETNAKIDSLVKVYDNVLDAETSLWLHEACQEWGSPDVSNGIGMGTWVMTFPLEEPERHTPVEQMLNQIMSQLYPGVTEPTYHVEFWSRANWNHVKAHQDMDEIYERQTNDRPEIPIKTPETGHVLYLKMGHLTKGPTIAWDARRGGDFDNIQNTSMVVIPAVQGRLLRFQGQLLHAVPRPADVYLFPTTAEEIDTPDNMRSVLLFNTWPINDSLVDAVVIGATEDEAPQPISKSCNPIEDWMPVEVVEHEPPKQSLLDYLIYGPWKRLIVPLMGNPRRWGMERPNAYIDAPADVADVLEAPSQVTQMTIRPTRPRLFGFEL
eukprot:Nitzschia sp. Nitz4//scaffold39_size137210//30235//31442//NITZ4_003191-RA/size137210-processed-gene-0.30-mRNA-1//1//CDS//3329550359//1367//frame0